MFKPNIIAFLIMFLLATVDISEAKGGRGGGGGRGGSRGSSGGGYRYRGSSGGYYSGGGGGFDFTIFLYVILGILGFCVLLWVLYKCCELAEDNDYQENNTNRTEGSIQPKYELNPTTVNDAKLTAQPDVYSQNKRQENNFNSAAINMPAKPEFNNSPSNFQTNTYGENNQMTPSRYSLGEVSGSQNERVENNFNPAFNPAFNPTFNPTAIEMPANPEYEARNNFPSNFQTNTYGAKNPMTPSSNLPYSLTPGKANGNQNGSELAYAGGWVNQSYKQKRSTSLAVLKKKFDRF